MKYHAKWAKNLENFAEAARLMILARGKIILNSVSGLPKRFLNKMKHFYLDIKYYYP